MVELVSTQVWRGGLSSNYVNKEPGSVGCQGKPHNPRQGEPGITISHNIASKGGGITSVLIDIGPQSFELIVREMFKADREAASRAIAAITDF